MQLAYDAPLLHHIRVALGATNEQLAKHGGVSRRTVQRWWAANAVVPGHYLVRYASAVHPIDRDLAVRLATAAGTTLVALGLEAPQPSPLVSQPHSVGLSDLANSVVFAAADAVDLAPKAVRPAVVAAFAQAQKLGLTVDALLPELARSPKPAARK